MTLEQLEDKRAILQAQQTTKMQKARDEDIDADIDDITRQIIKIRNSSVTKTVE